MLVFENIPTLRAQIRNWRKYSETIAFVPTMGNLHQGHLDLISYAYQHATKVIVSIFVNPLQFAPHEDFGSYPRTLEKDMNQCNAAQVAGVFIPTESVLFPEGKADTTQIVPPETLNHILCAVTRPHFFSGVATIVCKLLNIVQPDVAVFGKKDYQQLTIISKLVKDLNLDVKILSAPISRADNGLALSSRNQYLTEEQLNQASCLSAVLQQTKVCLLEGHADLPNLCQKAIEQLNQNGFKMDYFEIRSQNNLQEVTPQDKNLIILAAGTLGKARLIDNLEVNLIA